MQYRKIFTAGAFIKQARKKAKRNNYDISQASKDLAKEIIVTQLLYYGLLLLVGVTLLIVLAFTDWLGGPFVLAQIVLFLVVGTVLIASFGMWWLWRQIKQQINDMKKSEEKQTAREEARETVVIDGEISDKT